jgi:MOSC domain-containing protein YiiM
MSMTNGTMQVVSIHVGKVKSLQYNAKEFTTAMYKQPVQTAIYLSSLQLEGDEQADLVHHGGADKAVCVYSYEHYAYWEKELNRPMPRCAFSENLTVVGLLESEVCIGNIYRIDEALVQVSQPRQPCHKLGKKHDLVKLPLLVQETGYTGFYFRVLQAGWIGVSPQIKLEEEHPLGVTVSFANYIMHHAKDDLAGARQILAVNALSQSWRETLGSRLDT